MNRIIIAAASMLFLSGCAAPNPTGYEWGSYDKSLNEFYRNSQTQDALVIELERLEQQLGSDDSGYDPAALTLGADGRPDRRAIRDTVQAMRSDAGGKARIAPGLHAELGFLKLERGDADAAVRLFEREKRAWPEASYFMDTLIAWVKGDGKAAPVIGEPAK